MDTVKFNLAAPPNFRGLDSHKPLSIYHRHLPHWRQIGATYFVTFRLADALPQSQVRFLQRLREEWERTNGTPRGADAWTALTRQLFRQEETWLDEGHGSCVFRNPQLAQMLAEAILHFQGQRYFASCWVIMPNHCHLLIRPLQDWDLESILQGIKGTVARSVNRFIGGSGSIWQQESYDRIVRDEEHLWQIIQYIGRNPRRAGLPRETWHRWIDPNWETLGWRFQDEAQPYPSCRVPEKDGQDCPSYR
jgi:putative transposase